MRIIDADALMDEIYNLYIESADKIPTGTILYKICEAPTIGPAKHGRWISVKDRLPEADGVFLTYYAGGAFQVLPYSAKYKLFNAYSHFPEMTARLTGMKNVTHWMPLPEPPKDWKYNVE